jgi:hypothetical protein
MKHILLGIVAGSGLLLSTSVLRAGNLDNDVVGCAVGRPCIDGSSASGTDLTITWHSDQNWDKYHVRWSRQGQQTHTADPKGGSQGSFTIHNAHAGSAYSFSVEGCVTHYVGHDRCSPWEQQTITAGLAFGSDTCKQGFVWRDAVRDDHVCVTLAARDNAASDTAAAASRRQPGGGASGPDTCKIGFVWRGATPADHVCVTPQVRTQVAADNQMAPTRRLAK